MPLGQIPSTLILRKAVEAPRPQPRRASPGFGCEADAQCCLAWPLPHPGRAIFSIPCDWKGTCSGGIAVTEPGTFTRVKGSKSSASGLAAGEETIMKLNRIRVSAIGTALLAIA